MIRLKPEIEMPARECPKCAAILDVKGWTIPGMRNLAELQCPKCRTEFFADLPSGQGLYTPMLLEKMTGEIYDEYGVEWFAKWLFDSYANRRNEPIGFEVKNFSKLKNKIILLNCLDKPYGDLLLKLLNAQYYIDHQPDASLIILLPRFIEWLLPDGAAEAWIVDLPLNRGTEWNDWLANEIKSRLTTFEEVFLSVAFPHPYSEDYDIERFTRVAPFPLENLGEHQNKPIVTFIWREDRLWKIEKNSSSIEKIKRRLKVSRKSSNALLNEQAKKVTEFAECLRNKFPEVDFAVAGLGSSGSFPEWISDLRREKLNDDDERNWCKRYAASHLVVGVQGSNMLLPSIHAGSIIDLVGEEWWGNYLQDVLLRYADAREMFFHYRFVPHSTTLETLVLIAETILREEDFQRLMGKKFSRHQEKYDLSNWQSKKRIISSKS